MTGRACRYCKSPAWRSPCWWYLDHPDFLRMGADTPCACDDAAAEWDARQRHNMLIGLAMTVAIAAIALALAWLI
jgi:hypothetical protein